MATLDNLTIAKAIAVAISIGAILLNIEISLGLASYHVKPMLVGGIVVGGLLFGTGMAIPGLLSRHHGHFAGRRLSGCAYRYCWRIDRRTGLHSMVAVI